MKHFRLSILAGFAATALFSTTLAAEIPVVEPSLNILPQIDSTWTIAQLVNGNWQAGASVPLSGEALKAAARNMKGPVAVHIPPKTWSNVAIDALNALHDARINEVAIAVQQGAKVRYIPFCAPKAKTCFGKAWRGSNGKATPALFVNQKSIRIGSKGLLRKKSLESTEEELQTLKERFAKAKSLDVSAGKNTRFATLCNALSKSTFQNFTLSKGEAGGGDLLSFDSLLGGSVDVGDIGSARSKNSSGITRKSGKSDKVVAIKGVKNAVSKTTAIGTEKSRSTVDVELDEDFGGQKLPEGFMKKVAERLRTGTPPIHACYMAAKKDRPELIGKITVKFRVDKKGNVVSTEIVENELGKKAVGSCVQAAMSKITFPKPPSEDGLVLANTFVFENK